MRKQNIDRSWSFALGSANLMKQIQGELGDKIVDLPHDYMIESDVRPDAAPGPASGYYTAGAAYYSKSIPIPAEWEGDRIFLRFDGAMMNATVEVNGSKAALQHYGYAPFEADITDFIYCGKDNRVTVTVNPSMQPNSRWYSGAGLFRGVELAHTPPVHLPVDGIFAYTDKIDAAPDGTPETACLKLRAEVRNDTAEARVAEVEFRLARDGEDAALLTRRAKVQVGPLSAATAYAAMTLDAPALWSAETPNLYRLYAKVTDTGVFKTHLVPAARVTEDEESVLFGIRTVEADVKHGLRINGKSVKLRGGCLHHDNGVIGAVSLYDAEYRKLKLLRESGFNAVRTTHNPPSAAFIEAADRLGMYVFDEAFDAWGMGKQPGDYSQFFETDWERDLTAFVKRDRSHPSVIIWSTGNEITERGGLGNGYALAARLAEAVRALDPSRPVSNGICSFWNGLDDERMAEALRKMRESMSGGIQNADMGGKKDTTWEEYTEPFANGLDIVGYNYLEMKYEPDHVRFPERVMLGSENYPNEIGKNWPMIEATPYVIGDFTWTAFDYIGEAGIGKAVHVEKDDPALKMGPYALMSWDSAFPWRLANDADYDITGNILPQGVYRRLVWGSGETAVFSYDPAVFGKEELVSKWGFIDVRACWTWNGSEGKPVAVAVFSRADEVELLINGKTVGRQKAGERLAGDMPFTFLFETVYEPGTLEAVGYTGGKEVSRSEWKTAGAPRAIRLIPERTALAADGHALAYVRVEVVDGNGALVPDAAEKLTASAEGAGTLLGFGSGNPVTDENYSAGAFTTYRGRALAVLRAGYEPGTLTLRVASEKLGSAEVTIQVE